MIDVFLQTVDNYQVRKVTSEGREYLVVPVTMMVEGVHSGSSGPVLHYREELEKSIPEWEGRPVTVNHPIAEGVYVSASDSRVIEKYIVGMVKRVRIDNNMLKGEAWLDVQKLAALSPLALQEIQLNKTIEVSIGVFAEEELEAGVFNNEEYNKIARNLTPDHLALLPEGIGACSITDGCGIRVNSLNFNNRTMTEVKKCCPEKVSDLIANEQSKFTEEHREWLESLTEDQLAMLEPVIVEKVVEVNKEVKVPSPITNEQALEALKGSIKSTEDFLNIVPKEMREPFRAGLVLHQEKRNEFIASVMNYENNSWTKEELESMSIDNLEKLAKMVKPQVNRSVFGGRVEHNKVGEQDILLPTGVKLDK